MQGVISAPFNLILDIKINVGRFPLSVTCSVVTNLEVVKSELRVDEMRSRSLDAK